MAKEKKQEGDRKTSLQQFIYTRQETMVRQ